MGDVDVLENSASGNDASGNDFLTESDPEFFTRDFVERDLDLTSIDSKLVGIQDTLTEINTNLRSVDSQPMPSIHLDDWSGLDTYYVTTSRGTILPAVDKVKYFSVDQNGELINVSSSTIYAYDTNGNYYRWQPLGKCQYQYQSGYNTYWGDLSATLDHSNITVGQVGVNSYTDVILTLIFVVLAMIFFFRRK